MLVYIKPFSIFPELHSDTLFGALTYAISQLYSDKVEDMINEFNQSPPFLISSTFPFAYKNNEKIRFYPKLIINQIKELKDIDVVKKFKKINYLEEGIFFKLINGQLNEEDILNNYGNYFISNDLLMKENYGIELRVSNTIIPNNSVNRVTNETEGIFYTSGKEFKNLGLFFFIEFFNEDYKNIVEAALRFLKDRGFGRDISVGKGHFDYEVENCSISDLETDYGLTDSNQFITLSRFIPTKEDLSKIDVNSTYEIDSKRGRSSSGEIRKLVKFFKEGSVFDYYNDFYGQIIDSSKDSPAIEYGFAFPLKANFKGGE